LASDISAFGAAGVAQELELLVRTGRPQEVLDWTAPEHREALGGRFHWLRAQAFAAVGDYLWAEEECVQLGVGPEDAGGTEPRAAMAGIVAQHLMNGQLAVRHVGLAAWSAFAEQAFWSRLGQLVTAIRRDADARALRGLLALEEGNIDVAAAQFRDAVAIWGSDSATAEGSGIDFNGRPLAAGGLAWIESVHR
jgi:hypothetical protein